MKTFFTVALAAFLASTMVQAQEHGLDSAKIEEITGLKGFVCGVSRKPCVGRASRRQRCGACW